MEYVQLTLDDWMKMKEQLERDLNGVTESFVRIGYTLRKIEAQALYRNDGYETIAEFAQAEYGLSASVVSRFIAINRKYAIDGDSEYLRPEFRGMGSSKLGEMLTLPESDLAMIRRETTRESIRELKQFNRGEGHGGHGEEGLKDMVRKFFEEDPEGLNEIYDRGLLNDAGELAETVNPSGSRTFRKGRYIMMMYDDGIKIKAFGQDPQDMTWEEFASQIQQVFGEGSGKQTHALCFNEPAEQAEENTGLLKDSIITGDGGIVGSVDKSVDIMNRTGEGPLEKGTTCEKTLETTLGSPGYTDCAGAKKTVNSGTAEDLERENDAAEEDAGPEADEADTVSEEVEEDTEAMTENDRGTEKETAGETVSRKEYMETLTARGMSAYMAQEYRAHRLMANSMAWPETIEAWLTERVDKKGDPEEEK